MSYRETAFDFQNTALQATDAGLKGRFHCVFLLRTPVGLSQGKLTKKNLCRLPRINVHLALCLQHAAKMPDFTFLLKQMIWWLFLNFGKELKQGSLRGTGGAGSHD